MIKKTIRFENFNNVEEVEDFYFNLSKGELVKMHMSAIDDRTESFQDKLEAMSKNLQGKELMAVIEDIVLSSYGEKSADGTRFIKNAELTERFKSTGAFSELIVELCTDPKAAADFTNGLLPSNLKNAVKQEVASAERSQTARERSEAQLQGFQKKQEEPKSTIETVPELPASEPVFEDGPSEVSHPTTADLTNMSQADLIAHIQAGNVPARGF